MKIVIFSINPLFPDRIMGGAAKHSAAIARHLAELGHEVTVLCTGRADNRGGFRLHERAEVLPVLPFKQPFPLPYEMPPGQLAYILQTVGEHLAKAERFYMHDGEFLFPQAYAHLPTVISLRDLVYPETLLGGFLFQGDSLVAISPYAARCYAASMGQFSPEFRERLVTIPNGIDFGVFRPTPPSPELLALCPVDPEQHRIVLHPHRPETSKGLPQTLRVAEKLRYSYNIRNLRVLIPRWFDAAISPELRGYYAGIQAEIEERGLKDIIVWHDWIPQRLMPQYLSLGHLTLSLGHFVETFGNSVYESLACGTPVIAARVGPHRDLLPDNLLDKVHFDDNEDAAARAALILAEGRRTSAATLDHLQTHFDARTQLAAYADLIVRARERGPLPYRLRAIDDSTRWALAPWCYEWSRGFFHDFRAEHRALPGLSALLQRQPGGFTTPDAAQMQVGAETVQGWYREGWIVPG